MRAKAGWHCCKAKFDQGLTRRVEQAAPRVNPFTIGVTKVAGRSESILQPACSEMESPRVTNDSGNRDRFRRLRPK
jgi:hypothetical protein